MRIVIFTYRRFPTWNSRRTMQTRIFADFYHLWHSSNTTIIICEVIVRLFISSNIFSVNGRNVEVNYGYLINVTSKNSRKSANLTNITNLFASF